MFQCLLSNGQQSVFIMGSSEGELEEFEEACVNFVGSLS
jgi:hypothetical protein